LFRVLLKQGKNFITFNFIISVREDTNWGMR
jgi:hypothetical protein